MRIPIRRPAAAVLSAVLALNLCACSVAAPAPTRAGNSVSLAVEDPVTFRTLYSSEVETLNYLVSYSAVDTALSANVIDALVDYDSYGNILPGLAESWESNEDMTEWTFHLREGAGWYDWQGNFYAPVTADDWVASAQYVNDAANDSAIQYMYATGSVVEKAQDYFDYTDYQLHPEYYDSTPRRVDASEIGVRAKDDYTLVYTLEQPCPFFLSVLSYTTYLPVNRAFLKEQGGDLGAGKENLLYNGAYILTEFEPMGRHVLTRNPAYWDAERVHIDVISERYSPNAGEDGAAQYLAGEIDRAVVGADELRAAFADPVMADEIHQSRPDNSWSYFYMFNFDPQFDAAYEPENWAKAVVSENFRRSLMAGLDRLNALRVYEPDTPGLLLNNTITPQHAATAGGLDFTEYAALADIVTRDSFDEEAALAYRDAAREELAAAGVTFPIKILMPYNPATAGWRQECERVERQLEDLLGRDYIDIIVEAGPETAFLAEVRMSGRYAFMKCRWGADYADPLTWTEPFGKGSDYNFWHLCEDPKIATLHEAWASKVARASAIYDDEAKRFRFFAEAERLVIEHAIAIPFSISGGDGYVMSRLNQFEGEYAPYGIANQRYKGYVLHADSMNMEEFNAAYALWQAQKKTVQEVAR